VSGLVSSNQTADLRRRVVVQGINVAFDLISGAPLHAARVSRLMIVPSAVQSCSQPSPDSSRPDHDCLRGSS
jgi:hypothetical protein